MRAGKLRHKVTAIELVVTGEDDFGQEETEDKEVVFFFCNIEPLRGSELFEARQVTPETTHRISCRFVKELKAGMRIDFKGKSLELLEPPRSTESRDIDHEMFAREIIR